MLTIYHNGACSKCRGALEILQEKGVAHEIRWYLAEPLSEDELSALLKKLAIRAFELVRTTEALYREQYEGRQIEAAEWIKILVANPILIQRPIVEKGDKAIIARPGERVLEMI